GTEFVVTFGVGMHYGANTSRVAWSMIKSMKEYLDANGGEYRLNTKATELLTDGDSVVGIKAEYEGVEYEIKADAVIMATGGYLANKELVAKYKPGYENNGYDVSIGNDGSGLEMALEAGAVAKHMDICGFHALATWYNGVSRSLSSAANAGCIAVNAAGQRYTNEAGGYAEMEILDPDGNMVYRHRWFRRESMLKEYIDLKNARLWNPAGFGEQPLYTLRLCGKEYTFGIRTVRVLQEPDEPGSEYYNKCLEIKDSASGEAYDKNEEFSGFQLLVNDVPVLCKGANWVPSEPFPSAETDEKITELLELAKESGLNMLRVWGGGNFEKQHFYSECDRLGILVTQDFLMACGHYPEEDPAFIENLRKETEYAAYALRNHPCLMWWSGDNENAVTGDDEAEDYHGRTAIHQGILPALMRLDPRRRFMLSSPCGGKFYASKTVGTTHNTQYLGCSILPYLYNSDMKDYKEHFAQYLARFIAEEPTLGAVSLSSLKHMMTEEDIFGDLAMWEYHTKSNPALSEPLFETLRQVSRKVLGTFTDGADRFFKMKYLQYEWVRITLENIRRNRGFCNGVVYWMWNDCWPASSGWAFVDYYCKPKASFYSFKRCAAGLLASVHKTDRYEIHLCNDTLQDMNVRLVLSYLQNGRVTELEETTVTALAAASAVVHTLPLHAVPEDAVLLCDAFGEKAHDRAFYKNGALPLVPCAVKVEEQTANTITVTAESYVHAVELEGEFVFEDNYFSLLPGEKRTVAFRKIKDAADDALTVAGYTLG
ncbi:MAG: FAD-binding protein, partial [Clostridia bacterium]|nr:FAD-binding protein [Clostridia bacterium]